MKVDRRYAALRALASLLIIAAWVWLVLGLAASAAMLLGLARELAAQAGPLAQLGGGLVPAAVLLLYVLLVFVGLMGYGQLLRLFIDLEENTRRTAMLLESRRVS